MKREIDYTLYLVTDSSLTTTTTLEEAVEKAVKGGCTLVQLREKCVGTLEFFKTARRVQSVTRKYGVPLIVNDRVDIALAIEADGVHVGQSDLPAHVVRRIIGPDMLLGVSAATLAEALEAERQGADYLGVGAMFQTNTKAEAGIVSMETLASIRASVALPIVLIGGMNPRTLPQFFGTGVDGYAVVSAILSQPDIEEAARAIRALIEEGRARG